MEDRWLSLNEIREYLGVSSDTVYKWIDKHGMPAHRMVVYGSSRKTMLTHGEGWRCKRA